MRRSALGMHAVETGGRRIHVGLQPNVVSVLYIQLNTILAAEHIYPKSPVSTGRRPAGGIKCAVPTYPCPGN
ncbi:MAG: hypothetical protein WA118_14285 [Carboxydocellales bacterium]